MSDKEGFTGGQALTGSRISIPESYLIFVRNAVSVKFLAECKNIPEKKRKLLFWIFLYFLSRLF